ncbi:MAG: hypothetical protein Kow0090_18320 [Myxococcota bacterium]
MNGRLIESFRIISTAIIFAAFVSPVDAYGQQWGGGSSISSFMYPANPQLEKLSLEVEHLADNVLRRVGTYNVVDIERMLSPEAIKENALRVNYGRQSFDEGKEAFEALDLEAAQDKFLEATAFYEQALGYLPADGSYETTLMYMGASAYMQGDPAFAKAQFQKLIILAPDYQPDMSLFLPEVIQLFEEAKSEVTNMPYGALEITSAPPSVEVIIDNNYVGVTPITIPSLTAGEHIIITSRKGYVRQGQIVKVNAGAQGRINIQLKPTANFRVLSQSLAMSRTEYLRKQVGSGISELGRWLSLEQVLLGEVNYANEQVIVTLALFDIPSRKMLSQRQQNFIAQDPQIKLNIDRFIEQFVSGAPAPGEVEVAQQMAQQVAEAEMYQQEQAKLKKKPITEEWWFWTAVGGGALVVGGVAAYLLLSGGEAPPEASNMGTLVISY